jgi:hypothetical protein
MQTIIVVLIVAAAAVYVGRVFIRGFRQKGDCACGCSCCQLADSCTEATSRSAGDPPPNRPDASSNTAP